MKFTDIFVTRPVLASVVSLLILVLGLRSLSSLEIREYPETKDTVISVTTAYPGASSELIKGFITTPLQQAIAQADGIDYIFSTSSQGQSSIEAHMRLNYDANAAIAEIQAKVASQRGSLPSEARDPVITSKTSSTTSLIYLAFFSDHMEATQIADYLLRVIQPRLQSIPGVGQAKLLGSSVYAMRIWLKPKRMAALGLTSKDVTEALRSNNYLSSIGSTKGEYVSIDLGTSTDIAKQEEFFKLVVKVTSLGVLKHRVEHHAQTTMPLHATIFLFYGGTVETKITFFVRDWKFYCTSIAGVYVPLGEVNR